MLFVFKEIKKIIIKSMSSFENSDEWIEKLTNYVINTFWDISKYKIKNKKGISFKAIKEFDNVSLMIANKKYNLLNRDKYDYKIDYKTNEIKWYKKVSWKVNKVICWKTIKTFYEK